MKRHALRDLTTLQKRALLSAASFLLAGEWDETITLAEKSALERAVQKLEASLAETGGGIA